MDPFEFILAVLFCSAVLVYLVALYL